jgi:peptide/nickel transport system ATP-binding protein
MYLGRIVEVGDTEQVWSRPQHPYTEALVAAVPRPDGAGRLPLDLPGDVPDPADPPPGCRFHPRCPLVEDRCRSIDPILTRVADRQLACLVRGAAAGGARP